MLTYNAKDIQHYSYEVSSTSTLEESYHVWLPANRSDHGLEDLSTTFAADRLAPGRKTRTGDKECYHSQIQGHLSGKPDNAQIGKWIRTPGPNTTILINSTGYSPNERLALGLPYARSARYRKRTRFWSGSWVKTWKDKIVDQYVEFRQVSSNCFIVFRTTISYIEKTEYSSDSTDPELFTWVSYFYPVTTTSWGNRKWYYRSKTGSDQGDGYSRSYPISIGAAKSGDMSTAMADYDRLVAWHLANYRAHDLTGYPDRSSEATTISKTTVGGISPDDIERISERLNEFRRDIILGADPVSLQLWGALAEESVANCGYVDINTVSYLRDLKSTMSEIKTIAKLLGNPTNPKRWADLVLNMSYGTRLTIADSFELFNGLIRKSKEVKRKRKKYWKAVRARKTLGVDAHDLRVTSSVRNLNYKVYYRPDDSGIMNTVHELANWDLLPTATNVWDMIPYSFVVDWFIDVSSMLESFDRQAYAQSLDILGSLYTVKDVYELATDLKIGDYTLGTGRIVHYNRRWSRSLHVRRVDIESSTAYRNNIPQLLSVIVQKIKK